MSSNRSIGGSSGLKPIGKSDTYHDNDYDYGTEQGKAPSEWLGKGAKQLGLSGGVRKKDYLALVERLDPCDGKTPLTGRHSTNKARRKGRGEEVNEFSRDGRAAHEIVFAPPKSVTIAGLFDSRVAELHQRVVASVVARMECHAQALDQSRGKSGRASAVNTGNLVVAAFPHNTTREGQPHMHTHLRFMTVTQLANGKWRALAEKKLYESQTDIAAWYHAEMSAGLRELGYELEGNSHTYTLAAFSDRLINQNSYARLSRMERDFLVSEVQVQARLAKHMKSLGEEITKSPGAEGEPVWTMRGVRNVFAGTNTDRLPPALRSIVEEERAKIEAKLGKGRSHRIVARQNEKRVEMVRRLAARELKDGGVDVQFGRNWGIDKLVIAGVANPYHDLAALPAEVRAQLTAALERADKTVIQADKIEITGKERAEIANAVVRQNRPEKRLDPETGELKRYSTEELRESVIEAADDAGLKSDLETALAAIEAAKSGQGEVVARRQVVEVVRDCARTLLASRQAVTDEELYFSVLEATCGDYAPGQVLEGIEAAADLLKYEAPEDWSSEPQRLVTTREVVEADRTLVEQFVALRTEQAPTARVSDEQIAKLQTMGEDVRRLVETVINNEDLVTIAEVREFAALAKAGLAAVAEGSAGRLVELDAKLRDFAERLASLKRNDIAVVLGADKLSREQLSSIATKQAEVGCRSVLTMQPDFGRGNDAVHGVRDRAGLTTFAPGRAESIDERYQRELAAETASYQALTNGAHKQAPRAGERALRAFSSTSNLTVEEAVATRAAALLEKTSAVTRAALLEDVRWTYVREDGGELIPLFTDDEARVALTKSNQLLKAGYDIYGALTPPTDDETAEQNARRLHEEDKRIAVTTPEIMARERHNRKLVNEARGTTNSIELTDEKLREHSGDIKLDDYQAAAVKGVLHSADGVVILRGLPGTGKSTMLKVLRHAANENRLNVKAYGATVRASRGALRDAGFRDANTVASLRESVQAGKVCDLNPDDIVVVDEAGMLGMEDMEFLLELRKKHGFKLVPVGDTGQLSPVGHGDALRNLESGAGFEVGNDLFELREIRRQKNEQSLEVAKLLAAHDARGIDQAVAYGMVTNYGRGGRGIDYGKVAEQSLAHRQLGSAAVLALTNREIDEKINPAIRALLKERGQLDGKQSVHYSRLDNRYWTKPQKIDTGLYRTADVVKFHRHSGRMSHKGVAWVVTSVEDGKVMVRQQGDIGAEPKRLNTNYADNYCVFTERDNSIPFVTRRAGEAESGYVRRQQRATTERRCMEFCVGDDVRVVGCERVIGTGVGGQKSQFLANGHLDTIMALDSDYLTLKSGARVSAKGGSLYHAYAQTVHRVQGDEFDRTVLCLDSQAVRSAATAEAVNVMWSRVKWETVMHVEGVEALRRQVDENSSKRALAHEVTSHEFVQSREVECQREAISEQSPTQELNRDRLSA